MRMNSNSLFFLLLTANKLVWALTSWRERQSDQSLSTGHVVNFPWTESNPSVLPDAQFSPVVELALGFLRCLEQFQSLLDQFRWLVCVAGGLVTNVKTIQMSPYQCHTDNSAIAWVGGNHQHKGLRSESSSADLSVSPGFSLHLCGLGKMIYISSS